MKRTEKREQTRSRILQAAVHLFQEKGFEQTTVQEITASAEVAKGTFFNYFPTKESIMRALAEDRLLRVQEYMQTYKIQRMTLPSRIRAYAGYFLGDFHLNPSLTKHIWRHVVEHDSALLRTWEQLLESGVRQQEIDPSISSNRWAHIINSYFYYQLSIGVESDREELLHHFMQLVHAGIDSMLLKGGQETMEKIIVLGGGYGGMRFLQRVLGSDLPQDVDITLVDKLPYHCMKTEYYALAAGTESDHEVRVPFPDHSRLKIHFGTIDHIDMENQLVVMSDSSSLPYDKLVAGLGSVDNFHGVPGAEEHTYSIQSMEATRRTYEAISNLPPKSAVSIVGAGLSGVELASELRESRSDLHIRLFDRGETILPMFPKRLSNYVQNWFEKHDVEVISNSDITTVTAEGLYNHEDWIQSEAIIWTAGIQPNKIIRELDTEKDRKGRIILTPHHHLTNDENIFIVGDCASLPHAPSAQLAEGQAEQIATIMKKQWKNEPLPETMPEIKLKGTLGSLGKKHGFGVMGGTAKAAVTGRVARLLKSGVLWMYKNHSGV
ncbi:FAD-dependent oxidoreductase [Marinococcus luteus]|nr:FAD-dependent oxidoreductase [Marinococcus luteus]MDZ5783546.1 FAD-dependent oxidoreductase [Marinococcus luteus]